MKSIPLSQGKFALVDDEDFEWLMQWKWTYHSMGYAYHTMPRPEKTMILMHRHLLEARENQQVDHINGDKLDNRKSNLRLCSGSQNLANRSIPKNNTSGYKGVSWNKKDKKYEAYITIGGKRQRLGNFISPIDAAKAYNKKAIELYGEFARVNVLPTP